MQNSTTMKAIADAYRCVETQHKTGIFVIDVGPHEGGAQAARAAPA
jgi:hypothetical protein